MQGGMEKSRDGGMEGRMEGRMDAGSKEGGSEGGRTYVLLMVLSGIIAPKDVHTLTLGPCEHVSLYGKRDLQMGLN